MILPSDQIIYGLFLINIVIVMTLDLELIYQKVKSKRIRVDIFILFFILNKSMKYDIFKMNIFALKSNLNSYQFPLTHYL